VVPTSFSTGVPEHILVFSSLKCTDCASSDRRAP
jgi:hypothetical protein